jgi:hypothetical protein
VGGTSLHATTSLTGTATYEEAIWNNESFGLGAVDQDVTTSGCSTEFAPPPWQSPLLVGTSCAARATADLAGPASFFRNGVEGGILLVVPSVGADSGADGGPRFLQVEGTSAAAPLVAGIFARLGLTSEASNDLSWVYENATAFNDVGSIGYPTPAGASTTNAQGNTGCGKLCTAGPGWDGPTGVGTPNGANLVALPMSSMTVAYPDASLRKDDAGGAGETSTRASSCGCFAAGGNVPPMFATFGVSLALLAVVRLRHRRRRVASGETGRQARKMRSSSKVGAA